MPIVGAIGGALAGLGALGSLFSGIFGGSAKKDAAYAAADITNRQADLTRETTDEEFRRAQIRDRQVSGAARAMAGASGFAYGSAPGTPKNSMSAYVDAFTSELAKETSWARTMGYKKAALEDQSADVQRQAADAGLFGDIMGGTAGFLSGVGQGIKSAFG